MHTYSEYVASGVDWIGVVPAHWRLLPCRGALTEIEECGYEDEQLLSVTIAAGVIRQRELLRNTSKRDSSRLDRSSYKLVCPGDFVYNKMRAWQGAAGVSLYKGIVSPAYVVQRPATSAEPRYFHYLFRTPAFATEAERWSYGIASDMWSLRPEHFRNIRCCLPPLEEQQAIVRYLDHSERRIRRYVRAKERLIGLLEEEKKAIINQAVTRGLDPSVRMKASGVEWLGEVPEHWEVVPFGAVCSPKSIREMQHRELLSVYLNMGVVRFSDVDERRTNPTSEDLSRYQAVDPGDFVLNNQQAWRGSVGVSNHSGIVSPAYLVLSLESALDSEYANLLFRDRSMVAQYLVASRGVGTIQRNLYWPHLKRLVTLLPPLDEQAAIVVFATESTARIDVDIRRARRQVELIQEYRTRLIADVVTGKLDVREAAAGLGEEGDDEEIA